MRKTVLSFVALCALAVHAYDTWTDSAGYTWTYSAYSDGAEIRGVSPSTGSVTIPSILGDKPVTSIRSQAFLSCSGLTSVTIPDSVTSIGLQAFDGCSGLTSVTIPDGVTSIGEQAFYKCSGLTSVTIPDSVTSIGWGAFDGCSASLYDVNSIPGVKLVNGWAVGNTGTLTGGLDLTGVRGIAPIAFEDCSGLTGVTIPGSVKSIGSYTFRGCSGLTSVTIPDSVTSIGDMAFGGCSGLTSVTIPDGVTSIEDMAFESCSGLTSVTIPDSVTSIGNNVFFNCNSLRTLSVPERLRYSLVNATVPSGCKVFYRGRVVVDGVEWGYATDYAQASIVTSGPTNGVAEIPSTLGGCSVVAIGEGAFRNAAGLTRVVIPDGVTTIGDAAFAGCRGLTSVTIPDSVVDLPVSAFNGCTRLWASTFRNDGGPQTVSLTVTNVVVHFVTQSVPSAAVTPATNATGIVNIIAEVTASNAVAIAQDWAAQYPGFEAAFGADFTAALTMETGKRDGAGRPLRVWQDYVVGTDPTDPASLFVASIVHDAQTGDMIVSCSPELSPAEAAKRRYSVYGKANLTDSDWTLLGTGLPWRASGNSDYHFFRVTVEMR